jgi:hypothetical protein
VMCENLGASAGKPVGFVSQLNQIEGDVWGRM